MSLDSLKLVHIWYTRIRNTWAGITFERLRSNLWGLSVSQSRRIRVYNNGLSRNASDRRLFPIVDTSMFLRVRGVANRRRTSVRRQGDHSSVTIRQPFAPEALGLIFRIYQGE
jgi:hypothetical protein